MRCKEHCAQQQEATHRPSITPSNHPPALPAVVQAAGVLPANTVVSALVLGDLGAMPVPEVPANTQLPA